MIKLSATAKLDRLEFNGISASAGVAVGRVWIHRDIRSGDYSASGDPEVEENRLKSAIGLAGMEIASLLKNAKGHAATILGLQQAVYEDDTFFWAARNKLKNGQNSFEAWHDVLSAEISDYQSSDDTVFQARAFDLQDIQARVARILCEQAATIIPEGVIFVAKNLSPSAFIAHDWDGGGIALTQGSVASHLAILARQFGVPMVTNLDPTCLTLENGQLAAIMADDRKGSLIVSFKPEDLGNKAAQQSNLQIHKRGHFVADIERPIKLMINLSQLRELKSLNVQNFDGIGLVRTEFLLAGQNQNPFLADEETQFHAYCEILKWGKGKPVFIRTIDAGGDKAVSMKSFEAEFSNLRGLKLSLSLPDLFRVQVRALLRAAAFGPLQVTLPMVEGPADFDDAFNLFVDEANKLSREKITAALPSIGMMVEVPSVVHSLKSFAKAGHFAIGTNDLIELALGQPREAAVTRPSINNPVVLNLIRQIVAAGAEMKKPVFVCGDASSNPLDIPHLMAAGITNFSISPPSFFTVAHALGKKESSK